jgi:hypothetical protein
MTIQAKYLAMPATTLLQMWLVFALVVIALMAAMVVRDALRRYPPCLTIQRLTIQRLTIQRATAGIGVFVTRFKSGFCASICNVAAAASGRNAAATGAADTVQID